MTLEQRLKNLLETALSKITPPTLKNDSWKTAVSKWVSAYGYKKIGSGFFGAVYFNPKRPNEVIKIFSDKSYLRWVQICQTRLKGNPYVPVFKGKPVKLYPNMELRAIRLEKLVPANKFTYIIMEMRGYLEAHLSENYGVEPSTKPRGFKNYVSKHDAKIAEMRYGDDEDMQDVLMQLGNYLTRYDNSLHFSLDLHQGNVMLRGNQLVIVDPLASVQSIPGLRHLNSKPEYPDTEVD